MTTTHEPFQSRPDLKAIYDEARLWGCTHERAMNEALEVDAHELTTGWELGWQDACEGKVPNVPAGKSDRFADGYKSAYLDRESELMMAQYVREQA
jgi:hypothetical protein